MKLGWRLISILFISTVLAFAWSALPPQLARGPYLQNTSSTATTLVCKTSTASAVTLRYGEHAGPPWEGELTSPAGTTHVFALSGLRPETRYSFALEAGGSTLAGGAECAFSTAPPAQSRAPFRFLAWGDSGNGSRAQLDVAAWMERVLPAPTFALGLGDLVYDSGEWQNYDPRLFAPYAALFRRTTFWPALGNHDVKTENGAPYLDAFYLPTSSGAAGHPSGTERYYSFEHGMAHFVCLDSESSDSSPGGAMHAWLADDLDAARARGQRWLFAFMHHPPYTRGTHDSTSESDLIRVHDDLVPLFEAKGVDLVLTGHSHVYERSFLARNDAILQPDASEYSKIGSPDGTVYLVTGCGGESGSGPLDHPLMARSFGDVNGFNVIDVTWSEVRARFVERDGRTTDLFTVRKAADTLPPHVAALEVRARDELALVFDEPVRAGSGATGAENLANYALDPPAGVLSVALDSDQSTVVLATSELTPQRAYTLLVHGVSDAGGRALDEQVLFVHAEDAGSGQAVVPQGSQWRFSDGQSAPPAGWAARSFDDSGWSRGAAGFGYGDNDDATVLTGMQNVYATVYARIAFSLADPALVSGLSLDVSYDDGFVAYLNGTEIARANVPVGQSNTTFAAGAHEAGTFEPFDASAQRALLVAGSNVLALEGHNASLGSNDFSLHPELVLSLAAQGGPPLAVLDAPVRTANVPVRLHFSGAGSSDAEGPLAALRWDFGDGSAAATGTEVEHLYTRVGSFTVTLVVRDGDGLESAAQAAVRIHDQGSAPRAVLASAAADVQAGASVAFDATGSLDPDGGSLTYRWDFGDPASGSLDHTSTLAPSHTYASAGTYTATLIVTDDEGSSATSTATITVDGDSGGGGSGGGGGGGACSVAPSERGGQGSGDPLLFGVLLAALLALARRHAVPATPRAGGRALT